MGFLVDKTIEALRKTMVREADLIDGIPQTKKIEIVITTEDAATCEPVYRILKNRNYLLKEDGEGGYTQNWTFKQVIDKKLDVFSIEEGAKEHIRQGIARLANDNQVEATRVEVRAIAIENDSQARPIPYLFIDKKPIKQLRFDVDIFQEPAA